MLSRNFSLQQVGDLNWLRENYNLEAITNSIDELVVLNVERQKKNLIQFSENIIEITKNCFIPLAAGGGIHTVEDAYLLMKSGADKLVVNSLIIRDPETVIELVKTFGSQCIVASIDFKNRRGKTEVLIENGSFTTQLSIEEMVARACDLGAGEIYLTSIDRDGTGQGYDLSIISDVVKNCRVPVILSGGAGKFEHLVEGIKKVNANAVSTANLYNFIADGLIEARKYMREQGVDLANW